MTNFKKSSDYIFLKGPIFYRYRIDGYKKLLCNKNLKFIFSYIILFASIIYLLFSTRNDSQSIVFAAVTLLYSLYLTELNRVNDKYYNLNQFIEKIIVKKDKAIMCVKNDSNYDVFISKLTIFDDNNNEIASKIFGFFPKNDYIELEFNNKIDLKKIKYKIEMEISNIVICDKYIQYLTKDKSEYYMNKEKTFLVKYVYYKYNIKDILFLILLIGFTIFQIYCLIYS